MSTTEFAQRYLETWTEPQAERRHDNVRNTWAPDGRMVVSSIGATLVGVEQIIEHIDRVHEDVIVGKGVAFSYTQQVNAGDATLLSSAVTAPDGTVMGKGADVIFRDGDGRVTVAYMFMCLE